MGAIAKKKGFPLPSSLKVIAGTEVAQAAYPYYMQFSKEDDERFWFYNSMHFPEPMCVFDMITAEAAYVRPGRVQHTRTFLCRPRSALTAASSTVGFISAATP